jgi:hypothetical protein
MRRRGICGVPAFPMLLGSVLELCPVPLFRLPARYNVTHMSRAACVRTCRTCAQFIPVMAGLGANPTAGNTYKINGWAAGVSSR